MEDKPAKGILTLLKVKQITLEDVCQSRVKMKQDVIDDYAEKYQDPERRKRMPPPIIWHRPGKPYYCSDGFHRVFGAVKAGLEELECEVRSGELRDAILHSFGVNDEHGLRRTNDDKRRAVNALLTDPEWSKWTDRKIADAARVSHVFVAKVREAMRDESAPLTGNVSSENRTYITKHGTQSEMNVSNIGKKPAQTAQPPAVTDNVVSDQPDDAPPPPRPVDVNGKPLPDKAFKLHAQNAVMEAIAKDISALKARVKALDHTNFIEQQVNGYLDQARGTLLFSRATHLCPRCQGTDDSCKYCENKGIVTKTAAAGWSQGK